MAYYIASDRFGNYDLCHHGILGQKWGVRRYQNKDGSLTPAGEKHYSKKIQRHLDKQIKYERAKFKKDHEFPKSETDSAREKMFEEIKNSEENQRAKEAYKNLDSFIANLRKKYSDAEKDGFTYFDVYSDKEAAELHRLEKECSRTLSEYVKNVSKYYSKYEQEFLRSGLKDISIKDSPQNRELLKKIMTEKYRDDWWRYL